MINWIHQLLNPHCEHCAQERRLAREDKKEDVVCTSCETLREQLAIANREKQVLLERLLAPPVAAIIEEAPKEMTRPRMIPWRVKQQMLEQEDRKRAQIMRDAPKPDVKVDEELEKEIIAAETTRENTTHG